MTKAPIQNLKIGGDIVLDQDGNKFPTPTAKLEFLEGCLKAGIRSGNLKPITTQNQRNDLLRRIEQARQQVKAAK